MFLSSKEGVAFSVIAYYYVPVFGWLIAYLTYPVWFSLLVLPCLRTNYYDVRRTYRPDWEWVLRLTGVEHTSPLSPVYCLGTRLNIKILLGNPLILNYILHVLLVVG